LHLEASVRRHLRRRQRRSQEETMTVGKICVRTVHTASPDETVLDAARRMARQNTGTLVVLDLERLPIGILSDRDVMVRCVAEGKDPTATVVSALMSTPVASVRETMPIEEALAQMATCRVRRVPVVDDDDRLVGILAVDDVIELLVEEAGTIGRLLGGRS
jgi:CBS domain-containing protein